MANVNQDLIIAQTVALIKSYSFDLGKFTIEELMVQWLNTFHVNWIRLATIEALYLGRYKAISIEQILAVWLRIGSPNPHFTHEFERLICRKLPRYLAHLSPEADANFPELAEDSVGEEDSLLNLPATSETSDTKINLLSNDQEQEDLSVPEAMETTETNLSESEPESLFSPASALRLPYQGNLSRSKTEQKTIHKFTPLPDVSSFYHKLKALVQQKSEEE